MVWDTPSASLAPYPFLAPFFGLFFGLFFSFCLFGAGLLAFWLFLSVAVDAGIIICGGRWTSGRPPPPPGGGSCPPPLPSRRAPASRAPPPPPPRRRRSTTVPGMVYLPIHAVATLRRFGARRHWVPTAAEMFPWARGTTDGRP